MFTLLIDEEVMNLANKRDREFNQVQSHQYPTDYGRGNGTVKSASQGRRASSSSMAGIQMPESSSNTGMQTVGVPARFDRYSAGHKHSQSFEREAQSLSSTVPDVGVEGTEDSPVSSQHSVKYSRPSSVESHGMMLSTSTVTSMSNSDSTMETNRAGSTLDAIVSNLHSAAMELEMAASHESEEGSDGNHLSLPGVNHTKTVMVAPSFNHTEATSPSDASSPKNCSPPMAGEANPTRIVKVEPSEAPSSSAPAVSMATVGVPHMMVAPMNSPALDHKATLKMAPPEQVKGGNKKWQCVFCGILVSSKFYLSSHINAVHTRTRIYPCEICGKMFYSHGAQRIHKLRNHWVEKRHKCPFCGQLFVLPFELRQHVQKKHRSQAELNQTEQSQPAK